MTRPHCLIAGLIIPATLMSVVYYSAAAPQTGRARPNIVLIFADDLGWTDLGCFGSRYYQTPSIDRLARQGMRFTNAYTNGPNCAPTRACLISGRYTPRHGVFTVGTAERGQDRFRKMIPPQNRTSLPLQEVTVAEALKAAGYATAIFGKWHLGNGAEYHPSRRGFDEAIVSAGRHFNFRTSPLVQADASTYLADFLTDQALSFLDRNRDRPFFLYLPHFAVHTPLQAKQELVAKYKETKPVGGHRNPTYAAMIDSLDQSVGRITAKLDELKLADNTIVIFYSDNGGVGGYEELGGSAGRNITSNAPLRGGKGMLYEGGVRVPMIVRWPRVVDSGSISDQPVISIDFYPTFLDAAGAEGDPKHKLDGVSFLPLLKSGGRTRIQRDAIFWHFPGYLQADQRRGTWRTTPASAIRWGDWKLIEFFEERRIELYNLRDDIGETRNRADEMPDKARELHEQLVAWRKAVGAPMPRPKPAAGIKVPAM